MTAVPMEHGLFLAGLLFALGVLGVLVRRNLVFMLMSVEVMLNAGGLAFVVSVGLALVLRLYHKLKTLDADAARMMRG